MRTADPITESASLSVSLAQPELKGEDVPSHLSCVTKLCMKGGVTKKKKESERQRLILGKS